jgi:nucleotide-binding universal stress UspA family protein
MESPAERETVAVHPEGGVVVGDDGSRCAGIAVRAAAEEAVRRHVTLHVIRAWTIGNAVRPADVPAGIVPSIKEFEAATLAAEQSRIADLLRDSGVETQVHAVHAPPAKALLRASETADLLVVGTRGLGGFQHLLLGSVAEQCIRHARCPVLVVRNV